MKKQNNVLPIVLGVAVVIAAGFYFIVRANKRKTQSLEEKLGEGKEPQQQTSLPSGTPADTKPNYQFKFPIKYGDGMSAATSGKRENVRQLQLLIMRYDNRMLLPFNDDGKFGSKTEAALKSIIGKSSIDSQSDIDLLQQKTSDKAKGLIRNIGMQTLFGMATK